MTSVARRIRRFLRARWRIDLSARNELRLFRLKRQLFAGVSKWHRIDIVDLEEKGRALFLDDCARVFEADEHIYHEALIHPVMRMSLGLQRPLRTLLVGDGDGGGIRELLRFPHVSHLTWVEIDETLVDACRTHLRLLPSQAYVDRRLTLIIADGWEYMRSADTEFDVVIVSVTEDKRRGIERPLYSKEVYPIIRRILVRDGYLCRSLCALTPSDHVSFDAYVKDIAAEFPNNIAYSVGLPAYGIDWAFNIASRNAIPDPIWSYEDVAPRIFTEKFFGECVVRHTASISNANDHP